jgi:L,D-peptidoglycan transpeptidase YkuD (ErfK/YbiS/YcfS/YnhG family)
MCTSYSLIVFATLFGITSPTLFRSDKHPIETGQIAVVSTPSWASKTGTLQMFSRSHGRWIPFGENIAVVLGRNGLAWGIGLLKRPRSGAEKVEGDGCSPAGIFSLGPAFGYSERPPDGTRLQYRSITERDYYVDDSLSKDYNQWVQLPDTIPNDPNRHWRTAERMKGDDSCYEFGIVIHHNMSPVIKGKGSAIFLHVWESPDSSTAGCTAMSKTSIQILLRWLDPRRNPLLIQAPESEIPILMKRINMWQLRSGD